MSFKVRITGCVKCGEQINHFDRVTGMLQDYESLRSIISNILKSYSDSGCDTTNVSINIQTDPVTVNILRRTFEINGCAITYESITDIDQLLQFYLS